MYSNISFAIVAIVIEVVLLIIFSLSDRFVTKASRIYCVLVIAAIVVTVLDIESAMLGDSVAPDRLGPLYAVTSLHLLGFSGIKVLFYLYFVNIIRRKGLTCFDRTVAIAALGGYAVFIIPSVVTHAVFYFDDAFTYTLGPFFIVLPIITVILMGILLYLTFKYRSRLTRLQFQLTFIAIPLIALSNSYQVLSHGFLITSFAESLILIMLYLTLENSNHYYSQALKCLNDDAVRQTIKEKERKHQPFVSLVVRIEEFNYINQVFGARHANVILIDLAATLMRMVGFRATYHLSDADFVLIMDSGEVAALRERFSLRYPRTYVFDSQEIVVTPFVFTVSYPAVASTFGEVADTIHYAITHSDELTKAESTEATSDIVASIYREASINQMISRAIEQGNIEVYYQPIYDQEIGQVTGAEALARIDDPLSGIICAQEFIPIAEQNEKMIEIGTICFEQVCRFIANEAASRLDIRFVDFNLSVLECRDPTLATRLLAQMEQHHVSPDMLRFEVKEEVLFDDAIILNLDELHRAGCEFVINDFGIGISNIDYLINLPYRYAKIDKFSFWQALEDDRAMIVLRRAIVMMRDMGRMVLVEGIETEEQHKLLLRFGVTLQQGFYFSKPVRRKDYVEFLESPLPKSAVSREYQEFLENYHSASASTPRCLFARTKKARRLNGTHCGISRR